MFKELGVAIDIVNECARAKSESHRFLFFLMLAYASTGIKSDPRIVSEIVRHGMRVDDDMDRNKGLNMSRLLEDAETVFETFGNTKLQSHTTQFLRNYAHIEGLQQKIPQDQWTRDGLKTYREAAALPWAYVLTASTDPTIPLPPGIDEMPNLQAAHTQYLARPARFENDRQGKDFYGSFGLMMQVQVMGDMQGREWNIKHNNPAFGVEIFGEGWEEVCRQLLGGYSEITSMGGSRLISHVANILYPPIARHQHMLPGWGESTSIHSSS